LLISIINYYFGFVNFVLAIICKSLD